jgi:putative DNA primase/helicase
MMIISHNHHDIKTSFIKVMLDAQLESHTDLSISIDGHLQRFRVKDDKPGSKNGWYVLFNTGSIAGSFGNWKTGLSANWCATNKNQMSKAEHSKFKLQRQKAINEIERQRIQNHHSSAVKSGKLWDSASQQVKINHSYLVSKHIKAYGIRQLGENLLIPIQDAQNNLVSVQFIMPNGSKRFKSGGRIKGCFMLIGELEGTLFICEGYATGATIHQATGKSVIIAFNAANLSPVVTALKLLNITIKIIIVADNDISNKVNTGLIKGQECAHTHNLPLIYPTFSDDQPGSDFNDLVSFIGIAAAGGYLTKSIEGLCQ